MSMGNWRWRPKKSRHGELRGRRPDAINLKETTGSAAAAQPGVTSTAAAAAAEGGGGGVAEREDGPRPRWKRRERKEDGLQPVDRERCWAAEFSPVQFGTFFPPNNKSEEMF